MIKNIKNVSEIAKLVSEKEMKQLIIVKNVNPILNIITNLNIIQIVMKYVILIIILMNQVNIIAIDLVQKIIAN